MAKQPKPAGRAFSDTELAALVIAWDEGKTESLERIGSAAGVKLALEPLQAMPPRISKEDVLATIGQALAEPAGVAVHHHETWLCFVAIGGGKLVVGLAHRLSGKLSTPWPQLAPWSKDLLRNRKRVDEWLAQPERDDSYCCLGRFGFDVVPIDEEVMCNDDARIAELMAEIVRNPDDDAPRLVLADVLQQRGDPHGELVALQCSVAGPNTAQRIAQILRVHGQRIAGDVARHASAYEITRGFVSTVTMTAAKFASRGEELFAKHPIVMLHLDPLNAKALRKLAETKALSRVRSLVIAHRLHRKEAIPLTALGASPHLGRLVELHFFSVRADDWSAAFESMRAPALRTLSIEGSLWSSFDVRALAMLVGNRQLGPIERLELSTHFPGPRGWPRDAVIETFEILGTCSSLRRLHLVHCSNVDATALGRLFEGVGGRALVELDVTQCNEFDDDALATIASAGSALRRLCTNHTRVTEAGVRNLLASPLGRQLEVFEWRGENVR